MTERFTPSSVEKASTNVDFLPDLAPLQNGAFLFGDRGIDMRGGMGGQLAC